MKKFFIVIAVSIGMLYSCGESTNNSDNLQKETVVETETVQIDTLEQLKVEASRLRAGGSIKNVELSDNIAVIEYVKDYNEYKKLQPQSSLKEADLLAYWESGEAIKKALVDGSVRLMKKLDFLNGTKVILPYKGKVYTIAVTKEKLEKFVGSDMETIRNDWNNTFSDPYVYSETGREKFFSNLEQ